MDFELILWPQDRYADLEVASDPLYVQI